MPVPKFLVEAIHESGAMQYLVVAKDGNRLTWALAGTRHLGLAEHTDTANADSPTEESILADLRSAVSHLDSLQLRVWSLKIPQGSHHPRIWRSELQDGKPVPSNLIVDKFGLRLAFESARSAFRLLLRQIEEILEVVEPTQEQWNVFGHRPRHLLVLACTEVESAWKSVLMENDASIGNRLTTNDYVRLKAPMKLDEFVVKLISFPAVEMQPFKVWSAQNPTGSLPWYSAYNETKHGREMFLSSATLGHCMDAVAAVYIMCLAQFGAEFVDDRFIVTQGPRWSPDDCYMRAPDGDENAWAPVPYF